MTHSIAESCTASRYRFMKLHGSMGRAGLLLATDDGIVKANAVGPATFVNSFRLIPDSIEGSGDKRSDDYHQTEFKVSRMLTDTMETSLLYRYSKNNSNYELAEYDKNVVMLGIKYNF